MFPLRKLYMKIQSNFEILITFRNFVAIKEPLEITYFSNKISCIFMGNHYLCPPSPYADIREHFPVNLSHGDINKCLQIWNSFAFF